jgi:hypothetical protein
MWPFRQKPQPKREIQIVYRESYGARLSEWRQSEPATKEARLAISNQTISKMLDVLRREQREMTTIEITAPQELRLAMADRAAGYAQCLEDFESMARFEAEILPIESTFAKENNQLYGSET